MKIVCVTDRHTTNGQKTNGVRVAEAMRRAGHVVDIFGHRSMVKEKVAEADFILCFGTIMRPPDPHRAKVVSALRDVKRPGSTLALWYFDNCTPYREAGGVKNYSKMKFELVLSVAPYLDWLITTDGRYDWANVVRHYLHLPQGVDAAEFRKEPPPPEPRRYDVVFTGNTKRWSSPRESMLKALRAKFRVAAYGPSLGKRAYGDAFVRAHHEARVAWVPPPRGPQHDYWSNRIYLAAATGTPCVVGHVKGLEMHYEPGAEIVMYKGDREGIAAIAALRADRARRKALGDAARARTLRDHTYDARVETLMKAVFG